MMRYRFFTVCKLVVGFWWSFGRLSAQIFFQSSCLNADQKSASINKR